ncbi:hypothetical protein BDN72DRAFT_103198 [Pluteus cervinus]|uniref:Uncharacterized protein n=1 Tax=Pluteus cervinus TaxID=181527 RepID=A0ACD3B7Q9_9AGAR|nr:hypothetical protein BDN72DRAFT_103198 [Pluteus cervinus]
MDGLVSLSSAIFFLSDLPLLFIVPFFSAFLLSHSATVNPVLPYLYHNNDSHHLVLCVSLFFYTLPCFALLPCTLYDINLSFLYDSSVRLHKLLSSSFPPLHPLLCFSCRCVHPVPTLGAHDQGYCLRIYSYAYSRPRPPSVLNFVLSKIDWYDRVFPLFPTPDSDNERSPGSGYTFLTVERANGVHP